MPVTRVAVLRRYALFQLPELVLVALALTAALELAWVSPMQAGVLLGAWLLKEVVLFPFVRAAYEPSDPSATEGLIGRLAVVTSALTSPKSAGYVRLGGELWRARLAPGGSPQDVGAEVRVHSVEGVTLVVIPGANPTA